MISIGYAPLQNTSVTAADKAKKIARDLQICSAKHFLLSVRNLHNKYQVQIIGMCILTY